MVFQICLRRQLKVKVLLRKVKTISNKNLSFEIIYVQIKGEFSARLRTLVATSINKRKKEKNSCLYEEQTKV